MQQEEMAGFQLSPPQMKDIRPSAFKQIIFSFYYWRWQQACPWDQSEQAQLSRLLKCSPDLTAKRFKEWLYNYGCSDDITPGERPRRFLPRIHNYSVGILDRYGRSIDAKSGETFAERDSRNTSEAARRVLANLGGHGNDGYALGQAHERRPNAAITRRPRALPVAGD